MSKTIIFTLQKSGHYPYYNSILKSYSKNAEFIYIKSVNKYNLFTTILKFRSSKAVILNTDWFVKKAPIHLVIISVFFQNTKLLIYDSNVFTSKDKRYDIYRLYLIILLKIGKSVKILTLNQVKHVSKNIEKKTVVTTDPIIPLDKAIKPKKTFKEQNYPYLLLIGTHTKRKGTFEFLMSQCKNKLQILVVGKLIDPRLIELKGKNESNSLNNDVKFIEKYVSDNEMHSLFYHSEAIVVPYINWLGSSGILGHALNYNKPIIASSTGHIGSIVNEYTKGIIWTGDNKIQYSLEIIEQIQRMRSNATDLLQKYFDLNTFNSNIFN